MLRIDKIAAVFFAILLVSCGCGKTEKPVDNQEIIEDDLNAAFSSEALADIVEYERQKEGEGTEYNPWQSYGLTEMMDADAADDADFEYQEGDDLPQDEVEGQIPDATEDFVGEPLVYYLGHNVDFKAGKDDLSAFTKKAEDGVGVIDRFDDKDSRIDILIFNKSLYEDFVQKGQDQVRYTKVDDTTFVSRDSVGRDVEVCFAGAQNGGYVIRVKGK